MDYLRVTDVIKDDWLETYKLQRDILHSQLIGFNTNVFTLERIELFPFAVFIPMYDDRIFWQTTRNALVEAIIMVAWRIVVDKGENLLTLRHFKNEIFRNSRDETKSKLRDLWKEVDFESRISELEAKVINARHNYVAHLNKEFHLHPDEKLISKLALSLADIKSLLDAARKLFDLLCFTEHHSLWLWAYGERNVENHQTDVDKLLDMVAKNSRILNLPEEDPDALKRKLIKFSSSDLRVINQYRRKFDMSEINPDDFDK